MGLDLHERMDEMHPDQITADQFRTIAECYEEVGSVSSHVAAEGSDGDLTRRDADEILSHFIHEVAIRMESYEAAQEAITGAFPMPTNAGQE
jgi:hypothetical protein